MEVWVAVPKSGKKEKNKIFKEKKVSVNALRHSYLTDKYKQHVDISE